MPLPVILLPGLMCDRRLFAPLLDTGVFKTREVIIPDTAALAHDSMEAIANSVLEDAPPRFILGGLSMGGIAAMEVLRQAPERIAGLMLMDTNPLAESEKTKALRAGQIALAKKGRLSEVGQRKMIPEYLHSDSTRTDLIELCLAMIMDCGAEVFIRQSTALSGRGDRTGTLGQYKDPALILHGEDDRLCPADRHELMKKLMPHAAYHIIAGAGHLPVLEQPEAVAAVIAAMDFE